MKIIIDIKQILTQARRSVYRSVNQTLVEAYWLIGRRIVEEEQQGESRAVYGAGLLNQVSRELQKEFGRGFSIRNLEQMRLFYLEYQISQTVSAKLERGTFSYNRKTSETISRKSVVPKFNLSWFHYQILLRIEDKAERKFYEIEAAKNQWSVRELKRQFDSALYIRLALSKDKDGVKALSTKGQIFASRYKTVLPSKDELKKLLEQVTAETNWLPGTDLNRRPSD